MNNIVDSFKSMFKQGSDLITPSQARKIQEEHLKSIKKRGQKAYLRTPPYKKIEEHIYDENIQIAKCAVYNISQVAIHNPKRKNKVLEVLDTAINSDNITEELKEHIQEIILKINKS